MQFKLPSSTLRLIIFSTLTVSCSDSPVEVRGDAPRGDDLGISDHGAARDGRTDGFALVDGRLVGDAPPATPSCTPQGPVLQVGPGRAYETIGAALEAAQAGDTILVADGTYPESLTLSTGGSSEAARLQLCAENSRGATLQRSGRVL